MKAKIIGFFKKVGNAIKNFFVRFNQFWSKNNVLQTILTVIILPIVLTLVVEMLSRSSVLEGIRFMVTAPVPFIINALIIECTVLLALLFRRRVLVWLIVSAFWVMLGAINQSILSARVTPLNGTDIFMVKTGLRIANKYYAWYTIAFAILIVVLVLAFLVFVWIKGPKVQGKIRRVRNAVIIAAMCILTVGAVDLAIDTGKIASTFNNLPNAYKAYGFSYCFLNSIFDNGIRKPSNYSEGSIIELVSETETREKEISKVTDETPNIIVVQLESFFDITRMDNYQFSEDPIPNYRALMENCASGFFRVPSIGAGTSNTEFEVLTSMNLADFGAGEIPYKGILLETTCESVAYDLDANGYVSHAIHNNDATFYQRHTVYPNLGFDTFTSMEYMYLTKNDYTVKNWVKDSVLTPHIEDCLNYTEEGVDFVFTVSVEGHGSYPNTYVAGMDKVKVTSTDTHETNYAVQYYTNLINDMDVFIQELVDMLSQRNEPTILLLYGDHLPSLGLEQEHMKEGELTQTEYVVWNNMGLTFEFGDVYTYQIMPMILGSLGISDGVINNYHQTHINDEEVEYLSGLQNLEYDILYGAKSAFGGINPYETKNMKFGIRDVSINGCYKHTEGDDSYLMVEGENFTKWSMVNINGEYYKTKMIDDTCLKVKYDELLPQDEIFVAQVGDDKYQLSQTEPYIYVPE